VKFIHVFSEELKNKLLQGGYNLLAETSGIFIFENSSALFFNFEEADKRQFIFSNKMMF